MTLRSAYFCLGALAMMAGCGPAGEPEGYEQAKETLAKYEANDEAWAEFERYARFRGPKVIAFSKSGALGDIWVQGPRITPNKLREELGEAEYEKLMKRLTQSAIAECRDKLSKGASKCRILMIDDDYVWD